MPSAHSAGSACARKSSASLRYASACTGLVTPALPAIVMAGLSPPLTEPAPGRVVTGEPVGCEAVVGDAMPSAPVPVEAMPSVVALAEAARSKAALVVAVPAELVGQAVA